MGERKHCVACIVITYNRDDFIEACVTSLLAERSSELDIDVTVINNGAPDNTAEVLNRFAPEDVTVVTNEKNMPLSTVLNASLDIGHASDADFFLLLNDDIEMRPGAIAEMVAVCGEVPGAIVSPMQINYRQPDQVDTTMLERLQASDELVSDAAFGRETKRYYNQKSLIGAALLAPRETYAAIGDFDPAFSFYGLDDDYCNRAREMGIPLLVAMRAQMLHMHGRVSDTVTTSNEAWLRRWTTMYRARVLYKLKSPDHSLVRNYAQAVGGMLLDLVRFPLNRFPKGALIAGRTLVDVLASYPAVKARRKEEAAFLADYTERQA